MLDIQLRALKDRIFNPICQYVPTNITPLHITFVAFVAGLTACISATFEARTTSVTLWILNRALDCLDGALARHRNQSSDLGGFLDLLCDFVVYSCIPIACGLSQAATNGEVVHLWLSVAVVEASFHVNNFVLFFVAAVVERRGREEMETSRRSVARDGDGGGEGESRVTKELTSVTMRPALVEGTESALLFTVMLVWPEWTEGVCWAMAGLVGVGICQRVAWTTSALKGHGKLK